MQQVSCDMPGMSSRGPLNVLPLVVTECIFLSALSLKSSLRVLRASLALVLVALYVYGIVFTTLYHPAADYAMGGVFMIRIFMVGSLLLLPGDAPKLRNSEIKHGINPESLPFLRRLLRSCTLLWNPRGIGWNHCIPSAVIPKIYPISRQNFVLRRLLRVAFLFLVMDAGDALRVTHPLLSALARAEDCSKLRMRNQPYFIRCMLIALYGGLGYAGILIQADLLSVLCVGSGFSEPINWPDFCGPLSACWTVRRFWG